MICKSWIVGILVLAFRPADVEVRLADNMKEAFGDIPSFIHEGLNKASGTKNDNSDPTSKVAIVVDVSLGGGGNGVLFQADLSAPDYPEVEPKHLTCSVTERCNTATFVHAAVEEIGGILQEIDEVDKHRLEIAQEKPLQLELQNPSEAGEVLPQQSSVTDHPEETPHPGRALVASGAAILAVGVAGTVTGGVLLGQARRVEDRGVVPFIEDEQFSSQVYRSSWLSDHQAVPIGVMVGGLVASGAGIALVTVGATRMNRHKQTLSILPAPGSIVLSGRF